MMAVDHARALVADFGVFYIYVYIARRGVANDHFIGK